MKKKYIFFIFFIIVFLTITCENSERQISKDELKNILNSQNKKLAECFINGNAEKLAEIYTDSAKLSPNGYDFVVGKNKIKEFWEEDFKTSKILEMNTNTLTIDGNNEVIYETGKTTSKILYEDSIYNVTVKYINVWIKQEDQTYKLDIDFWNKDL